MSIRYLRAIGAGGLFLGLGAMILSTFFWWSAGMLYLGLGVLALDVWFEDELSIVVKGVLTLVIGFLIGGFTMGVVTFPAPLEVSSIWDKADFATGTDVSGIKWGDGMSRLIVFVGNSSDRDYSDFDFFIYTTESIAQVRQATAIPCEPVEQNIMTVTGSGLSPIQRFVAKKPQRFRCDKLPKHSTIEMVVALVNADPLWQMFQTHPKSGTPFPGFFGPKRKPEQIFVHGTYTVTYRPREVSVTIKVGS